MTHSRIVRNYGLHANALTAAASLLGLALGCQPVEAGDEAAVATNNGQLPVSHQIKVPAASNQWKHYAPKAAGINQRTLTPGSTNQKETIAASSLHQKETISGPESQPLSSGASTQLKWNTSAPPSRDPRAGINPQPLPPKILPPPKNPPKFK